MSNAIAPAAALLAALPLLTGCGGAECTDIGASSGVQVTLADSVAEGSPVEACAAGECGTAEALDSTAFVPLSSLRSTDPVEVRVRVSGREHTETLTPEKVQPNGPGCEPTVHQAKIRLPGT